MKQSPLFSLIGAIALVWVVVIAASWAIWGSWVAFAYVNALLLGAAAAVFFLWARGGLRRSPRVDEIDAPFVGYPAGHVMAILDHREAAIGAATDLREALPASTVSIFSGRVGAAALDSEGTAHGLVGVVERSIEHLLADESDLQRYDEAVRTGAVVVGVEADGEATETARSVLLAHGAYDIFHFGTLTVERLDVDRSRTAPGASGPGA